MIVYSNINITSIYLYSKIKISTQQNINIDFK